MFKKALGELDSGAGTADDLANKVIEKSKEKLSNDPNQMQEVVSEVVNENANNEGKLLEPTPEGTQKITDSVKQKLEANKMSGTRDLLQRLNVKYGSEELDLNTALKVWKQARLTPEMIRDQIKNDVNVRVSLAEAKILCKIGSEVNSSFQEMGISGEMDVITQNLITKNSVKLTPSVRAAVEKVGHNLYRTKQASTVMWKIDLKAMDNGQQVPYLLRVEDNDTVEK